MLEKLKMFNLKVNNIMLWIAGLALMVSMMMVVLNGIIRTFTNPFSGVVEVVSWLAAITTAFSLGSAQISKSHVFIDMLFEKFNPFVKKVVEIITMSMGIIFFILLMYQLVQYGLTLKESTTLSTTLRVAFYPFVILTAFGFLGLIMTMIIQLLEILSGKETRHES